MDFLLEKFLLYLKKERNYSSHTIMAYSTDLNQFCEFVSEQHNNISINDINKTFLRSYLAHLKKTLGDRVAFMGGIDASNVLNFGTPRDVEEEVGQGLSRPGHL